ncbi:hypothetical protein [Calidifontibacter indicus]|uniref:Uncharacterized protein n=1 Tax=Calidifontibacter indicus TaxID=419650 RepID=A0A3D9UVA5_9MICO|nr:hypothetical protein [Calidifontibacter indicus]REF31890.1 hypothetical protein DFJ65_2975 [Calidifontibacter indicus]
MNALRTMSDRLIRRVLEVTGDRERGDVPGWVLITLMTAGLVTAIWQFAQPQLTSLFDNAIHGVSGGQ